MNIIENMGENMNQNITHFRFNNIDGVCFVGDVHGEWKTLGYKAVEQYQLENHVIIQLGDFGIGFNSEEYNKIELKKLNTKLKKRNNQLVALRGNHDDKKYFDGQYSKSYSNIHLIPDYTVIEISYEKDVPDDGIQSTTGYINILCVGGGLSVDRTERRKWEWAKPGKKFYWEDELPVYDELKLDEINEKYPNDIHIIASHTAPSFVYPQTKSGIQYWLVHDMQLYDDLNTERSTMDKIIEYLKPHQSRLKEWYYAHFHCTQNCKIDGVIFRLLDICEFREFNLV